jgi:hypothetical protein
MMDTTMDSTFEFSSLSFEQLADVTGGFDWKSFAGATGTGAVGGAVGGAILGAGTGPGAAVSALGGAAGGAVAGGVYNAGQQFGWWR